MAFYAQTATGLWASAKLLFSCLKDRYQKGRRRKMGKLQASTQQFVKPKISLPTQVVMTSSAAPDVTVNTLIHKFEWKLYVY